MHQSNAERVDAQYELEALSMQMGIARYRATLAKQGDAAVSAGEQLIKAAIRPMEEALAEWLKVTAEGLAGRSAGVFHFVNQLDPVVTSWLTACAAIGLLHGRPTLTMMATNLAMQMEGAVNMEEIAAAQPSLAAKMAKRLKTMNDVGNKLVFIRKGSALGDVKIIQWDNNVRVRMGTLLLTMFAQSTGLIAIDTVRTGFNKSSTLVRPTESCRRWLEESHARCELMTPARLPMVCTPRPWTSPFNGGYLTKQMRRPIVKTRHKAYLAELKEWEMPNVYASINALQGTEWAVNVAIYETIKALWESGAATGALPSRFDAEMPARTWAEGETPADEALHVWKVGAARTYEANAKQSSKRMQLVQKLWTAEMMLERNNRFHYVYNLDWRGRMYPVGSDLNPQGDDVAKAMLQFHKAVPLGEEGAYWLAVHGANTFGIDKVSFEERIQWVEANSEAIIAAGNDPTCGTMWWTEADSPFMFLAFCMEWAKLQNWVDGGAAEADFPSSLPVAFDGACNGLQNFSAMLRDPVGGAATGLVPGEKPADIYSEVAKAAQVLIDQAASEGSEVAQRWVGKMTRKLAKRNTMTVPYGVTRRGMKDQLFSELADGVTDSSTLAADAGFLAGCNYEAIGTVVVAAQQAMDWLREAAKVAAKNALPVRWETPMGFLAVQDYRVPVGDKVDFEVLGQRYTLMLQRDGDKLDTRKQSLGISPNFVHSLDAAHLMRTVLFCAEDGMVDFSMIHDSYGCHAGHASLLRDNLRDAFVDQYSKPVLEAFRDQLAEQLPEELRDLLPALPAMGSLDLEGVRKSDYFFA